MTAGCGPGDPMICKHYCIQCEDVHSGKVGNFFYERDAQGRFTAVSPVFSGLADFYLWAKAQGFRQDPQHPNDLVMLAPDGPASPPGNPDDPLDETQVPGTFP